VPCTLLTEVNVPVTVKVSWGDPLEK